MVKVGSLFSSKYSRVPNRRVGWNKRVGGKIAGNLINKLDGIKELVGNCTKMSWLEILVISLN